PNTASFALPSLPPRITTASRASPPSTRTATRPSPPWSSRSRTGSSSSSSPLARDASGPVLTRAQPHPLRVVVSAACARAHRRTGTDPRRAVCVAHGEGGIIRPGLAPGVVLAVEELNAHGGVLGRPVEFLVEDIQSQSGESATVVKKLIARDRVVAVLGGNASNNSLEAAPFCQAAHVPMIAISSTSPKVTAMGNYIFRACFIDPFQGAVLAKFARTTLHARRVALLTSVSAPYSVGLSRGFRERFTAAGGEIVAE